MIKRKKNVLQHCVHDTLQIAFENKKITISITNSKILNWYT